METPVFVHRYFNVSSRIAGCLHDMGAVPLPACQGNVLVSGQQQVKRQFFAQPAGNVLIRIRKQSAGFQVTLYSSVIDADQYVVRRQIVYGFPCGG